MTTPKIPPRIKQPSHPTGSIELSKSIDELEHLITDTSPVLSDLHTDTMIPVLDDVIDHDNMIHTNHPEYEYAGITIADTGTDSISPDQIESLVHNVEEKIAGELDTLVNILKDTIKDSIMTELKSQLETEVNQKKSLKSGGGK
ncbi:MAG: hypothetical protein HY356_05395 [Gammaproteobacteria bacterium]|nr:hypothetical protein [Gammaproteobacteria bacterium]